MQPHSTSVAISLAEQALLFCAQYPEHPLTPFIRAKALVVSKEPEDPSAYLALHILYSPIATR